MSIETFAFESRGAHGLVQYPIMPLRYVSAIHEVLGFVRIDPTGASYPSARTSYAPYVPIQQNAIAGLEDGKYYIVEPSVRSAWGGVVVIAVPSWQGLPPCEGGTCKRCRTRGWHNLNRLQSEAYWMRRITEEIRDGWTCDVIVMMCREKVAVGTPVETVPGSYMYTDGKRRRQVMTLSVFARDRDEQRSVAAEIKEALEVLDER